MHRVDRTTHWGGVCVCLSVCQAVMACGAAVVGALAVAPSIRSVKSYMVATCPPEWAEEYLGAGLGERWWVRLALHLNMVLPLAVLLLWVRPLMEEPLQITPELMLHLRVGALAFAGLLQVRLITAARRFPLRSVFHGCTSKSMLISSQSLGAGSPVRAVLCYSEAGGARVREVVVVRRQCVHR
jgi:hypothetical protein